MTFFAALEVAEPLRGCFLHSEMICFLECCGIDAISRDPQLIAAWSRDVGNQQSRMALKQIEELIVQVEDPSHNITIVFLNARILGEITRSEMLTFLRVFETALRSCIMNELLTRAEMEARFDGEWVLVADPELDKDREVVKGRVAYHGKDREAMYDCDEALQLKHAAYLYFGPMPKMRVLLNYWRQSAVECPL